MRDKSLRSNLFCLLICTITKRYMEKRDQEIGFCRSKINRIMPTSIAKLYFQMWKTNISTQKIDDFFIKTDSIIILIFQVLEMHGYLHFS